MREGARQLIAAALNVCRSLARTISATWRRWRLIRGDNGCTIPAADMVHNEPFDIASPVVNACPDANVGASITALALAIERAQRAPPI
jgi:hypothetical protein